MLFKIGFEQAYNLIMANVPQLPVERRSPSDLNHEVLAEPCLANVDSPSLDVSLKDGYAVVSGDIGDAGTTFPVKLTLLRSQAAGDSPGEPIKSGQTVRVTTGAPVPPGADAVLAGEFAKEADGFVVCVRDAEPGRNILLRGADVCRGQTIARKGEKLHPALIGLMAAAGVDTVSVYARPSVAVIGTGDEIVAPGHKLGEGKLYASNIVETANWLKRFKMRQVKTIIAPDKVEAIRNVILNHVESVDVFVTSGGSWGSERDLMIKALDGLGWSGIFHRVRLGPGKAVGFGLLDGKAVFILPGGPPSHEAALLLLALPGILKMTGWTGPLFPLLPTRIASTVGGQSDWTQVVHGLLRQDNGLFEFHPVKSTSRLSSMAKKDALLVIPEKTEIIEAGQTVDVQWLVPGGAI